MRMSKARWQGLQAIMAEHFFLIQTILGVGRKEMLIFKAHLSYSLGSSIDVRGKQ